MKCNGMKSRVLIWIGLLFFAGEILCLAQPEDLRQRLLLDTANRYFMANNADFAYAGYYNNLGQALSEMGEEDSAFFYFER